MPQICRAACFKQRHFRTFVSQMLKKMQKHCSPLSCTSAYCEFRCFLRDNGNGTFFLLLTFQGDPEIDARFYWENNQQNGQTFNEGTRWESTLATEEISTAKTSGRFLDFHHSLPIEIPLCWTNSLAQIPVAIIVSDHNELSALEVQLEELNSSLRWTVGAIKKNEER